MATKLRSRSKSSERSRSTTGRSTRRSSDTESTRSRSTTRSVSKSSSRSDSRSRTVSGSESRSRSASRSDRSTSTNSDGDTTERSVATSASYKSSRSTSTRSTPTTMRKTSVKSGDGKVESGINKKEKDILHSAYKPGATLRWRKREPSYKPRYPQNGLNAIKIEGVKRDTFDYYIHRRKIAEVKSMVDNRPPQIYPHVYYDMKKLRKRQEEQAMIQRNNHRLLSKLVVAMTTTRIDNIPKNRDSYIRNKQKDHKRVERLMGTMSRTNSLPRFGN